MLNFYKTGHTLSKGAIAFAVFSFALFWGMQPVQAQIWTETFDGAGPFDWSVENAPGSRTNPTPAGITGLDYIPNQDGNNYFIINDANTPELDMDGNYVRGRRLECGAPHNLPNPYSTTGVNNSLHITHKAEADGNQLGTMGDPDYSDNWSSSNQGVGLDGNSDQIAYMTAGISTLGNCNLRLQADMYLGGDRDRIRSYSSVLYSIDAGVTWEILADNIGPTNWSLAGTCDYWERRTFELPADCDDVADLRFAFRWRNDNSFPITTADYSYYAGFNIDNIMLFTGEVPVPSFTAAPVAPFCKTTYTLTNTTVDNAAPASMVYRWTVPAANPNVNFANAGDFTDLGGDVYETTDKSLSPSVQFTANGSYDVILDAENCNGNAETPFTLTFDVVDCPPVADFSANLTTVCATDPAPVNPSSETITAFTDLSINSPTSWSWSFDPATVTFENGTSDTDQNPEVSFDSPGVYEVTLEATNADGSDTETKTGYIIALNCQCVAPAASTTPEVLFEEDFDGTDNWQTTAGQPDMFDGGLPNGANRNEWYINDDASGGTDGDCGVAGTGNNSLFVGIEAGSYGTLASGASYADATDLVNTVTNILTPSQVFSTEGYKDITLDFDYFMGNVNPAADRALVYYSLDGNDWELLATPAPTLCCAETSTPVASCPDATCTADGGTCDPGGAPTGCDLGGGCTAWAGWAGFINNCTECVVFGGTCCGGGDPSCTTIEPAQPCTGSDLGNWTAITTIELPEEAEDQAEVYLAFFWQNDGNNGSFFGTFLFTPSFAVDNIVVRGVPSIVPITAADATVWEGTTADWHDADNWSDGVPTNTQNVLIPKPADLAPSTPMPVITAAAEAKSICNEGTLTIGTADDNFTLTVGEPGVGGFINNYGTIRTPNADPTADIIMIGGDSRYRGDGLTHDVDFRIAGATTVATFENDLSCRDFVLAEGELVLENRTLTLKRNFDAPDGALTSNATTTLRFDGPAAGNWTNPYEEGTPDYAFVYTDDAQTVGAAVPLTLPNMQVNKASGTLTATNTADISISAALDIPSGIFDINTRTVSGPATLSMADAGELHISKEAVTVPELTGAYSLSNGSHVRIYGAGNNQAVRGATYGRLTNEADVPATRAQDGDVEVTNLLLLSQVLHQQGTTRLHGTGGLTMENNAILNIGNTTEEVPALEGLYSLEDLTTVALLGAGNQELKPISTATTATTGADGYAILAFGGTGRKQLNANTDVRNNLVLDLTEGDGNYVDAQAHELYVRNPVGSGLALAMGDAVQRNGGHVVGWLKRAIDNTAAFDYTFPVGSSGEDNDTYYEPVRVASTGAWAPTNTFLRARFRTGTPSPNIISPPAEIAGVDYERFQEEGYWTIEAEEDLVGGNTYEVETFPSVDGWAFGDDIILAKSDVLAACPPASALCRWDLTSGTIVGRDQRQGFTSFSDFAYAIPDNVLPVVSGQLAAVAMQQSINLNWQTTQEKDNLGFQLERSTDGQQFSALSFVEGAGTTNKRSTYSLMDYEVVPGVLYYYRYRAISADGSAHYSNVASALLRDEKTAKFAHSVYPNPAHTEAHFSVLTEQTAQVVIDIYDLSGKRVTQLGNTLQQAGRVDYTWHTQQVSRGMYFYTLRVGSQQQTGKLVLE